MKEAVLLSEQFPRGVVFRLTLNRDRVQIRWQWKQRSYILESDTVPEAVQEALAAVQALEAEGLV